MMCLVKLFIIIMRLGKYEEGKTRDMKITLKSQVTAEGLLINA